MPNRFKRPREKSRFHYYYGLTDFQPARKRVRASMMLRIAIWEQAPACGFAHPIFLRADEVIA